MSFLRAAFCFEHSSSVRFGLVPGALIHRSRVAMCISLPSSLKPRRFSKPSSAMASNTTQSKSKGRDSAALEAEEFSKYKFPSSKLKKQLEDPSKTPLVIVGTGCYSPLTYLHLRTFEMAADFVKFDSDKYEMVGQIISPVSDAYGKKGLVQAEHRLEMCNRATASTDIIVDPWEAQQAAYTPTAQVLDHLAREINELGGGFAAADGSRKPARILLMGGADLFESMATPGVWSDEDIAHILGRYGGCVIERSGTEVAAVTDFLKEWKDNLIVVPQAVKNDVSSTKIRALLADGRSVRFLIPDTACEYIAEHGLYRKT